MTIPLTPAEQHSAFVPDEVTCSCDPKTFGIAPPALTWDDVPTPPGGGF